MPTAQHKMELLYGTVFFISLLIRVSKTDLPNFTSDHYVEDHVTLYTHVDYVQGLRYNNEDKPEHCRNDLCLLDETMDRRKGDFTWPVTVVGYRRLVRCPYSVHSPVYGHRDCRLVPNDNGTMVPGWGEVHIAECPGTPLTESLKAAKAYLNRTAHFNEDETENHYTAIVASISMYSDQDLFEDNMRDLYHVMLTSLVRAVDSGQPVASSTAQTALQLVDWLIATHESYFAGSVLDRQIYSKIIWMLTMVTEMMLPPSGEKSITIQEHTVSVSVEITDSRHSDDVSFNTTDPRDAMATHVTVHMPWEGQKVVRLLYLPLPDYFYRVSLATVPGEPVFHGPDSLVTPALYASVATSTAWSAPDSSGTLDRRTDAIIQYTMYYNTGVVVDLHSTQCAHKSLFVGDADVELREWNPNTCSNSVNSKTSDTACSCRGSGFFGVIGSILPNAMGGYAYDYYFPDFDVRKHNTKTSMAVFLGFPYRYELYVTSHVFRAVSLTCLLLTVLSYSVYRKSRKGTPTKILLNLCGSLIALLVALYVAEAISYSKIGCRVSNVLRYYFILVTLLWNGIEAINMYLMLVRVFSHQIRHFVLKAAAVAWGAPLVPIIIVFIADVKGFDGVYTDDCEFRCRLKKTVLYYGYLLPLSLILVHNIVVFALVINVLRKNGSRIASTKTQDRGILLRLCGAVSMMVLLGIPWIFSAFGAIDAVETTVALKNMEAIFHVVFVVCVNLQGVFIFCFHCARNAEMRQQWKSTLSRTRSTAFSSSSTRRSSSSTDADKRRKGSHVESSLVSGKSQQADSQANDNLLPSKGASTTV